MRVVCRVRRWTVPAFGGGGSGKRFGVVGRGVGGRGARHRVFDCVVVRSAGWKRGQFYAALTSFLVVARSTYFPSRVPFRESTFQSVNGTKKELACVPMAE